MWRLPALHEVGITNPTDGPCSHICPSRVQGMPCRLCFPSGVTGRSFLPCSAPQEVPQWTLSLVSHFCWGLARLVSWRHWLQDGNIGAFVYSFSSLPPRPVVGSGCVPVLEATAPPASACVVLGSSNRGLPCPLVPGRLGRWLSAIASPSPSPSCASFSSPWPSLGSLH